jgi:hypothetical protein
LDVRKICGNAYALYAASGMIFHDYKRIPISVFRVKIAAPEHLKGVTGRIFRISK